MQSNLIIFTEEAMIKFVKTLIILNSVIFYCNFFVKKPKKKLSILHYLISDIHFSCYPLLAT